MTGAAGGDGTDTVMTYYDHSWTGPDAHPDGDHGAAPVLCARRGHARHLRANLLSLWVRVTQVVGATTAAHRLLTRRPDFYRSGQ